MMAFISCFLQGFLLLARRLICYYVRSCAACCELFALSLQGDRAMNKKTLFGLLCLMAAMILVASGVSSGEKVNADPKRQLPDPDTKPPATDKPVKVFLLMGQSNMVGFGQIDPDTTKGTLSHLVRIEKKYPHLVDDAGKWTVRNDVWCDFRLMGPGWRLFRNWRSKSSSGTS